MLIADEHRLHILSRTHPQAANSRGDTPLHMAAYHGQEWAVDTLLRLGADCLAVNDKGQSPFRVARHNTVRSMLKSAVAPGETVTASTGDVGVESGVGRPKDNDSGNAIAVLHRSPIHQEQNSPSRGRINDVREGNAHRRFGQESGGAFSGAEPPGADTRRQGGELTSKRYHGNVQSPTNDRSDGGMADCDGEGFDRSVNGSLVSSLVPTGAWSEETFSFQEKSGGDLSFEEGSSEGAPSLESEGDVR